MSKKTQARNNLETKAAFIYFITLIFIAFLSAFFQYIGNVDLAGILKPFLVFSVGAGLAYVVYSKKKKGESSQVFMWIVAMITIIIPVYAKFNYASNAGSTPEAWTFALESYNSSVLIIAMIILQQLLFDKKIILTSTVLGFVGWISFIFIALKNGAEYSNLAMDDQGGLLHGFILLREYYFIIIGILIAIVSYRNVPVIDDYDKQVTEHNKVIELRKLQLEEVFKTVDDLSVELAKISETVNLASKELSRNSSSQAVNLEEIVASMEEMSGSVSNTTATAKKTNEITKTTSKQAFEGKNVVKQTVLAMNEITEKISIIEEIAFQTNILALNAAVEAARAGSEGKGFAVVAGEVRKLAEKSQDAVKSIQEVGTRNLKISEQVIELFNKMEPNVKQAADLMAIATEATIEQEAGINQVNSGLEELNLITQKNSSSAGELAGLSDKLYNQSKKLLAILESA